MPYSAMVMEVIRNPYQGPPKVKQLFRLVALIIAQGDHLSGKPGKPGNVREFDSCQGKVSDFAKNHGHVRGKSCQGKVA